MSASRSRFPRDGGEMGDLIRNHNWADTTLGATDTWPASLRIQVQLLLGSRFPMLIVWGPQLLTFYNDAFGRLLGSGGERQASPGQPCGTILAAAWPAIGPVIRDIMAGGSAVWLEDLQLPLRQDGKPDQGYWSCSLSALYDDDENTGGVLMACAETTRAVTGFQELKRTAERLDDLFAQTSAGIAMTDLAGNYTEVNNRFCELLGYSREELLQRPDDAITHPDDLEQTRKLRRQLIESRTGFLHHQRYIRKDGLSIWVTNSVSIDEDASGDPQITTVSIDNTAQKLNELEVVESNARFRNMIRDISVGFVLLMGDEMRVALVNAAYCKLIGFSIEETLHRPLFDVIPDAENRFMHILQDVLRTGEPFQMSGTAYNVHAADGSPISGYINFVYQPYREADGTITGVMAVVIDVTEELKAKQQLELAVQIGDLGDYRIDITAGTCTYSPQVAEWLQLDATGCSLQDLFRRAHPDDQESAQQAIEGSVTGENGGRHDITYRVATAAGGYRYLRSVGQVQLEHGAPAEIVGILQDVTAQVTSRRALEASEAKLRGIVSTAPAGIGLFVGRDLVIENPNQTFIDIVGKGWGVDGMPLRDAMPELITEGQPFLRILDDVYTTGIPFISSGALVKIVQHGVLTSRYYNISYSPVYDGEGQVYAVLDVAIDVTEQIEARQQAEEAREALRGAIEIAELGTWSLDVAGSRIICSERMAGWFGMAGDSSGADAFFACIQSSDRKRVHAAMYATLDPGSDGIFSAEFTVLHPASGRRRIISASGRALAGEGGTPNRLSGTAQDITLHRELQTTLEVEVLQRTEELAAAVEELRATNEALEETNTRLTHSNDELAQYAYVASHDLQEPLRKIRVFADMLTGYSELPETAQLTLERIQSSAERMSLLIQDLLSFSRLLKSDTLMRPVALQETVAAIWDDFELTIGETSADLETAALPTLQAVNLQMNQLFYNLISNALKFRAAGRAPRIRITAKPISHAEAEKHVGTLLDFSQYYHIQVSDNGIGFETRYNEQIFDVFKRLHGRDVYPGSGIGLALCRRIVANHNGALYATSAANEGSTFHIILPDRQFDVASQFSDADPMIFPDMG